MAADPRSDAEAYLNKHNIPLLIEYLTTAIAFHRPAHPRDFLKEALSNCAIHQKANTPMPWLFTDEDLKTMFGIFDVTGCGKITGAQLKQALLNIGIRDSKIEVNSKAGIDLQTFVSTCKEELKAHALTFS